MSLLTYNRRLCHCVLCTTKSVADGVRIHKSYTCVDSDATTYCFVLWALGVFHTTDVLLMISMSHVTLGMAFGRAFRCHEEMSRPKRKSFYYIDCSDFMNM
ncbi:hypothetical protein ABBQ38_000187 [Trebouxia sp. C0009 RCD-2024]